MNKSNDRGASDLSVLVVDEELEPLPLAHVKHSLRVESERRREIRGRAWEGEKGRKNREPVSKR